MIIRNVILDWSGTLVDDLMPVVTTTNHVLAACGLAALSREEFRAQFCLPIRKFYETRVPHVSQARLEQIFLAEYPKHHAEITLLPHTLEFLRFCQQRQMGVYIASTVDAHTYETQMARFGIGSYITKPYIGIEDKTAKIHHILDENALDRDGNKSTFSANDLTRKHFHTFNPLMSLCVRPVTSVFRSRSKRPWLTEKRLSQPTSGLFLKLCNTKSTV